MSTIAKFDLNYFSFKKSQKSIYALNRYNSSIHLDAISL